MRVLKRFTKTSAGQKLIGFIFYYITKLISRSIRWEYFEQSKKSNIYNNKHQALFAIKFNKIPLNIFSLHEDFHPKNL